MIPVLDAKMVQHSVAIHSYAPASFDYSIVPLSAIRWKRFHSQGLRFPGKNVVVLVFRDLPIALDQNLSRKAKLRPGW